MLSPSSLLTIPTMFSSCSHWLSVARKALVNLISSTYYHASHLASTTKHLLHCLVLLAFILVFEVSAGGIPVLKDFRKETVDPWSEYGTALTILLYVLRCLTILPLPLTLFQFLGLVLYNAFPPKPELKSALMACPFMCIRVVTKGDYVELVKRNVLRNMNLCLDLGMDRFIIEVVTDKAIDLASNPRVREIVVPKTYESKSGSLFKARALQYCLEEEVNMLNGDDYIVHLDEETLLTDGALRGIINFASDGKHDFGQGLITYANEQIVNWLTTMADMMRVSDDMGRLRFQFRCFHRPIFNWKGSYVVTRCSSERAVTYDNGPAGSVAEDCYFALKATSMGYTFDWIEGEMWEKSPFTVWDFLQQRKRWIQGMYLTVHSREIPWRTKYAVAFSLYLWLSMPISLTNIILAGVYPIPCGVIMDFVVCFIGAVQLYLYVFGVMKSFSMYRIGLCRLVLFTVCAACTLPFNIFIENIAVVWGLIGYKTKFYVVKKELKPPIQV